MSGWLSWFVEDALKYVMAALAGIALFCLERDILKRRDR